MEHPVFLINLLTFKVCTLYIFAEHVLIPFFVDFTCFLMWYIPCIHVEIYQFPSYCFALDMTNMMEYTFGYFSAFDFHLDIYNQLDIYLKIC